MPFLHNISLYDLFLLMGNFTIKRSVTQRKEMSMGLGALGTVSPSPHRGRETWWAKGSCTAWSRTCQGLSQCSHWDSRLVFREMPGSKWNGNMLTCYRRKQSQDPQRVKSLTLCHRHAHCGGRSAWHTFMYVCTYVCMYVYDCFYT